jgi:hypothetical protein
LACKNGGDIIKRHNKLRNFIFNIAQQCGANPVLEKKNILGDCDSGKRPADVLLPSWSHGKDFAIDVAITDPINGTFKLDMEACNKYADKYKHDKYDNGFINTQIEFIPVVFSTFGSLNEEGHSFLKDLFRRNCDSLDKMRCTYITLLWQKLSISLQTENCKMMSKRFKLSNQLLKSNISTKDEIPEIYEGQVEKVQDSIQSFQLQNLDYFLKERKEESNIIQSDPQEAEEFHLQEDNTKENERLDYSTNQNLIIEKESEEITNIKNEDSDFDSFPKKGDKVKVKYADGWYIGKVHSISSKKKKYFWVEFKGFDDLYKVRKEEKFKII